MSNVAIVKFANGTKRVFETVAYPEVIAGDMVVADGQLGTVVGKMTATEDELGFIASLTEEKLPLNKIDGLVKMFTYEEEDF